MFHRAPPEEPGFGVTISTPGSTMSSHPSMPERVARPDDDDDHGVGDDAVVLVVLPVLRDEAGVDQAGHVALEGEVDVVGGLARLDRAALVARGAVGRAELDALALRGLR